jgi:BirA family biotin operon repressor/biotin-[acetyl-CoA-carboxylase] ligase
VLAEVDSTLDEARRVAQGLAGPEWILALRQTKARGRRGRAWVNPEGNFAATLVLRLDGAPGQAALRSFVASLALRDALVAVGCAPEAITLKWPNDVLLKDGKLAGILLESLAAKGGGLLLSIGIGVNLRAAPPAEAVEPGAVRPVSLLGETGVEVSPEAFLNALATAYAGWEDRFRAYGFAPIRSAWLQDAARLDEVITARTGTEEITGTFRDVDNEGQLVLETPKAVRHIPAADVFF